MEAISKFSNDIYQKYMVEHNKDDKLGISLGLKEALFQFLKTIEVSDDFKEEFEERKKNLLITNKIVWDELCKNFRCIGDKITDLNSAVMGIPNTNDSDLDFVITVGSIQEQKEVDDKLLSLGYPLTHVYTESSPSDIQWHSHTAMVEALGIGKVEIEIKIRSEKIVKVILIAHRNIRDMLSPEQKLQISYVKTLLSKSHEHKQQYKKFKYIIYGAMFNGHRDAIIFRL